MNLILSYLVLAICVFCCDCAKFRCDYTYFPDALGWLKLHSTPSTWREARQMCHLEGADIASPTTDGIVDSMTSLMYDDITITAVHTGIVDSYSQKGSFEYVEVDWIMTDNATFESVRQTSRHPFICYKKGAEFIELTECGTLDGDYTLDVRTGKCYKFHPKRGTWYRANFTCVVEGGHLAIINSDDEAQVIADVFDRNPADSIPGEVWKDNAFLGFRRLDGRNWKTIEGQTLSEAGFSRFAPGEPNNSRGDEFCGSVGRNGKLFDDPCLRELPFICERRTDSCDQSQATIPFKKDAFKMKLSLQDNNIY